MYVIEQKQPFAQSRIWQLERDYYTAAGINAWSSGEVPHYVTSNPVVGKTYAEMVLAFLCDRALRGQQAETLYLLELGAGHGRLCYHFFKHFEKYYENSPIPLPPFCYVLSDFAEANLAFWREHPRLQPYLERRWLDFARFDVESSSELHLQRAGVTLGTQALAQPLIVVANYFFDTIPQNLFRIEDQTISTCLVSLETDSDPAAMNTAELISALRLTYTYEQAQQPIYADEPILEELVESYRQQLSDTHLLVPDTGIRCLERLQRLSRQGLLLLTADKGHHHLPALENQPAPELTSHGSFSLNVNYHALGEYCARRGGLALFPHQQPASLNLGCLFFVADAPNYDATINAYERFVNDFGPDDYFSLKRWVEQHFDSMSMRDILSILHLSAFDARIFAQMLPRLFTLLPNITYMESLNLYQSIHRVWDTYYPLGEVHDLAFDLGRLLFALNYFQAALIYFQLSAQLYGPKPDILYNIALCHFRVDESSKALEIVEMLKARDPDDEMVATLYQYLSASATDVSAE